MNVVRSMKFPAKIRKIIADAPHYPEGSGVRLEIKSAADLDPVKQLAKVKVEN
jgi:hypothetical protein